MLKAVAEDFVKVVLDLSRWERIEELCHGDQELFKAERRKLDDALAVIKQYASMLNLKSALGRIRDIELQSLRPEENLLDDLVRDVKELQRDVIESLDGEKFLYIPPTKADYWENDEYFGEEVIGRIDDARKDIREACSCFAVGRYTATVYHCIGIMQAALFKLAQHIGSERIDLDVDDWDSAIRKIIRAVAVLETHAKANSGDPVAWAEWKRLDAKYNEIISDAKAVMKAWRHPSAHFRDFYDEPDARKVLAKVGDFVADVTDLLPPKKKSQRLIKLLHKRRRKRR
jgi:hypothetical protein